MLGEVAVIAAEQQARCVGEACMASLERPLEQRVVHHLRRLLGRARAPYVYVLRSMPGKKILS